MFQNNLSLKRYKDYEQNILHKLMKKFSILMILLLK